MWKYAEIESHEYTPSSRLKNMSDGRRKYATPEDALKAKWEASKRRYQEKRKADPTPRIYNKNATTAAGPVINATRMSAMQEDENGTLPKKQRIHLTPRLSIPGISYKSPK